MSSDSKEYDVLKDFVNQGKELLRIVKLAEDLDNYFFDKTEQEIEFAQRWLETLKEHRKKERTE